MTRPSDEVIAWVVGEQDWLILEIEVRGTCDDGSFSFETKRLHGGGGGGVEGKDVVVSGLNKGRTCHMYQLYHHV